ncbi:MAG: MATE family efflux transporter [Eggerthellaceae bacterium]
MNHTIEEKNGAPEEVSGSSSGAPLHHGAKAGKQNAVSDRVNRMGTGSIPKLVVEFAIPAILGMVVNGAYNLIDSVFLGHGAGEMGLSAITVASPTMTIFLALAMLIGAGGNALCALRLGEGKHDEAEHILGNTATLGVIVSVALAVLAHIPFVVEPLLDLSSATEAVRPYAREFIQIISLGCVFQVVGMGLNNFIRTTGAPNRALVTMLIGASVARFSMPSSCCGSAGALRVAHGQPCAVRRSAVQRLSGISRKHPGCPCACVVVISPSRRS